MVNIGGIIKSIQNIMRQDKGLNGDAQRIEQLGWMIFLKIFDDKDIEMELLLDDYLSPIPSELQWRNWAKDDEGMTGDELLDFIDGKLFPALKSLPAAATVKSSFQPVRFHQDGLHPCDGADPRDAVTALPEQQDGVRLIGK